MIEFSFDRKLKGLDTKIGNSRLKGVEYFLTFQLYFSNVCDKITKGGMFSSKWAIVSCQFWERIFDFGHYLEKTILPRTLYTIFMKILKMNHQWIDHGHSLVLYIRVTFSNVRKRALLRNPIFRRVPVQNRYSESRDFFNWLRRLEPTGWLQR